MPAVAINAIDLFPYWTDDRALLADIAAQFTDADLDVRPAPGLASVGEMLRHIITTEEHWWYGGILGRPWEEWRPAGWPTFTEADKHAYRRQRFPAIAALLDGLRAAHAPLLAWLRDLPADELCDKRRATWGEHNTLRWMLWHLVEHDQHHRAQLGLRARALGRAVPGIWPRPGVMAGTPAAGWPAGAVEIRDVVPFWKPLHTSTRKAVAVLTDADLGFASGPAGPAIHDVVLQIVLGEDFFVRQAIGGEMGRDAPPLQAGLWRAVDAEPAAGARQVFPAVASLLAAMDRVHETTGEVIARLRIQDLGRTIETAAGPESVHHALWHAREHVVHHRARLFFLMRLAGRTPPPV